MGVLMDAALPCATAACQEPKQRGIFTVVATPHSLVTTTEIIGRIIEHRLVYEERNRRKLNKAEAEQKLKAQEMQQSAQT